MATEGYLLSANDKRLIQDLLNSYSSLRQNQKDVEEAPPMDGPVIAYVVKVPTGGIPEITFPRGRPPVPGTAQCTIHQLTWDDADTQEELTEVEGSQEWVYNLGALIEPFNTPYVLAIREGMTGKLVTNCCGGGPITGTGTTGTGTTGTGTTGTGTTGTGTTGTGTTGTGSTGTGSTGTGTGSTGTGSTGTGTTGTGTTGTGTGTTGTGSTGTGTSGTGTGTGSTGTGSETGTGTSGTGSTGTGSSGTGTTGTGSTGTLPPPTGTGSPPPTGTGSPPPTGTGTDCATILGVDLDTLAVSTSPDYILGIKDGCLVRVPVSNCSVTGS